MAKEIEKLTPARVVALKNRGQYADGDGLYLVIDKRGNKSWVYRFTSHKTICRTRYMGLGSANHFTLKEARQRAADARRLKLHGIDPITNREAELAAAIAARRIEPTFEQATITWHEANKGAWAKKTQNNWISSMRAYAFPVLGKMPLSAVTTSKVLEVIEPIWREKNKTAGQMRARIEVVLAAAKVAGFVTGENPARWENHLDAVLMAPGKIAPPDRHAAVPYAEMPAFMTKLRARDGVAERALEFIALTGVRSGEALGAVWSEIDLDQATWSIPAARMKMRKGHVVPLCERALVILRALPRESAAGDWVFVGARRGNHLGRNYLPSLMSEMGAPRRFTDSARRSGAGPLRAPMFRVTSARRRWLTMSAGQRAPISAPTCCRSGALS